VYRGVWLCAFLSVPSFGFPVSRKTVYGGRHLLSISVLGPSLSFPFFVLFSFRSSRCPRASLCHAEDCTKFVSGGFAFQSSTDARIAGNAVFFFRPNSSRLRAFQAPLFCFASNSVAAFLAMRREYQGCAWLTRTCS